MTKHKYILDSFAWVEYFKGTPKGKIAAPYIEGGEGLTPVIVIAELSAFYARESLTTWEQDFRFIESKTALLDLPVEIAKQAGKTRQEMRKARNNFGLIDAIIYELGLSQKGSVITGDPHFEELPHVIFLKD